MKNGVGTAFDGSIGPDELHGFLESFARELGKAGSGTLKRPIEYPFASCMVPAPDPKSAKAAVAVVNQNWSVEERRAHTSLSFVSLVVAVRCGFTSAVDEPVETIAMKEIRIGISGWTYPPWRQVFFPEGWPQRRELEYASRQVNSIEINGTFYSLQRPSSYRAWYDATPDGFVFSVKGGRFITHIKRLKGIATPLANFFCVGCAFTSREARADSLAIAAEFPL